MNDVRVIVGGSIEEDGAAFVEAWRRAEAGGVVQDRTVAFESWDSLSKVMTAERFRLLRRLRAHPEPSVSALARALGRQYRRVHDDVTALEKAGLVDRSRNGVRVTAERISAEVRL